MPVSKRLPSAVIFLALIFSFSVTSYAANWENRARELRIGMREILTLPSMPCDLAPETRNAVQAGDYRIEAVSYQSEAGSRVTASLYLPARIDSPVPAIVIACGHGGSKSGFYAQYAGQLYAKLGYACLIPDTIGEEEREASGKMGARGHDTYHFGNHTRQFVEQRLKRSVLGKIVLDLIRGIDYLETCPEIDGNRIGIAGYSLGGTTAGCVAAVDPRIRAAVIAGWHFSPRFTDEGKYCSKLPYIAFKDIMDFSEMTALLTPRGATLFICGEKDNIIDSKGEGVNNIREMESNIPAALKILKDAGSDTDIEYVFVPEAGHRPFFLSERAVDFFRARLGNGAATDFTRAATVPFGEWVDSQGGSIEKLYNTDRHERGLMAVECGAVLRDRRELACFPDRHIPEPSYTMQGWINMVVADNFRDDYNALLGTQDWRRDTDGPIVSLGKSGDFDDTHLISPMVACENGIYSLWYPGSRGVVDERVFRLGYATSSDGVAFEKSELSPVFEFGDGKRSVLTPTLLRSPDGAVLREDGKLRMWFSAVDLTTTGAPHTLHEAWSADGVAWSPPSNAQLVNVYAPTIIKEGDRYRLWYTDVSGEPWVMRHAWSADGRSWIVSEKPALIIDQGWEKDRLFYPTVLKMDGFYVMWYGSYWTARDQTTAIGSAVSADGLEWTKNPVNPVLRPDPARPWESHYTTSQSVMRLPDGSYRIWYATRKAPPFENKYFAIGTAALKRK